MNKKLKKENNVGATNSRPEKGITLVALVITIIVLIILAGVSINAVMNGGLITNAKDAKNEYEEGKQKEETEVTDLEVKTDFATKITIGQEKLNNGDTTINAEDVVEHTPYLFKNGYLTGVELAAHNAEVNEKCAETVRSFRNKLPIGYEICDREGNEITDENIFVGTGMVIKKNGQKVGRVVVYGDTHWQETDNATISAMDRMLINRFTSKEYLDYINGLDMIEARMIAADVDHDGDVDTDDSACMSKYIGGYSNFEQNAEAIMPEIVYTEETDDTENTTNNEMTE